MSDHHYTGWYAEHAPAHLERLCKAFAASLRSQLSKANEELKWRRGTAELMRQAVNGQLASLRESWNAEVAVSSGLRSQLEQVTAQRDSLYGVIDRCRRDLKYYAVKLESTEDELARVRQELAAIKGEK